MKTINLLESIVRGYTSDLHLNYGIDFESEILNLYAENEKPQAAAIRKALKNNYPQYNDRDYRTFVIMLNEYNNAEIIGLSEAGFYSVTFRYYATGKKRNIYLADAWSKKDINDFRNMTVKYIVISQKIDNLKKPKTESRFPDNNKRYKIINEIGMTINGSIHTKSQADVVTENGGKLWFRYWGDGPIYTGAVLDYIKLGNYYFDKSGYYVKEIRQNRMMKAVKMRADKKRDIVVNTDFSEKIQLINASREHMQKVVRETIAKKDLTAMSYQYVNLFSKLNSYFNDCTRTVNRMTEKMYSDMSGAERDVENIKNTAIAIYSLIDTL